MKSDKVALLESLVRLSFIMVFLIALTVGTYGLVSICQMLMNSEIPGPSLLTAIE